ncbi:hypothetical protein QUB63_26620 [Microcoleus sp. ARI1-B5]
MQHNGFRFLNKLFEILIAIGRCWQLRSIRDLGGDRLLIDL